MRKNSIITTVLIALLAVLMFVGCEQSAPFKYVVSASVTSEDFLVGQAFDPNKITVTVNYSDGKSSTLTGVGTATNLKDGKVDINSTVTVSAGLDVQGDEYEKTIALPVYEATGIEVTAPEAVTVANDDVTSLDANLFTVVASYAKGTVTLLPNVDYTVTIDASSIGAGETKTIAATVDVTGIFGSNPTAQIAVTNAAEGTPVTPLDDYVWNNELAYSITDSYAFNREAFNADNFQLYRVYRSEAGAQLAAGYYLMPVDATFYLTDATKEEAYAATGASAEVKVSYKYVPEGVSTGAQTELTTVAFSVDPSKYTADAEGRLVPNKGVTGAYSNSSTITMNLSPDYVTAVEVELAEGVTGLYVGDTVTADKLVVTATYASGYVADGEDGNKLDSNSGYTVAPSEALKLGDKVTVTVSGDYGTNASKYGKSATFDTGIAVQDYIVSFSLALADEEKVFLTGEAVETSDFVFSDFVYKSGAKSATLPAGAVINVKRGLFTTTETGTQNAFFTVTINGKESDQMLLAVTVDADYPTAVAIKEVPEITTGTSYANAGITFNVTWASGNTYEDGGAPSISYTYNPTTAGAAGTAETVSITWTCGEYNNNDNPITRSITPVEA